MDDDKNPRHFMDYETRPSHLMDDKKKSIHFLERQEIKHVLTTIMIGAAVLMLLITIYMIYFE